MSTTKSSTVVRGAIGVGILLVAAVAALQLFGEAADKGRTPDGAAAVFAPTNLPKPEPVNELVAMPPAKSPEKNPGASLQLPDGSKVPTLNGVDTPVSWGDRPFSPIVGRHVTDSGIEWYVHKDGLQSTTVRVQGEGPAAGNIRSLLILARPKRDAVRPLKPGIPR